MFPPTRRSVLAAALAIPTLGLAACSRGGPAPGQAPTPVTDAEFQQAMDTETELTFWTWTPDIQKEVDLFRQAYPKIGVNVVNAGQGQAEYTKLRTVLRAGRGAPDVVQLEFQFLPSFLLGDNLLDLSGSRGYSDLQQLYPEWVWQQVSRGSGIYAVPQDTGPLGLLYRDDLFTQAGVAPPGTWDEFATAAQAYRAAIPDSYLTNFAPGQPGQFIGLMWANGAQPFAYDGDRTVSIDFSSEQVTSVASYWQQLIAEDLVAIDPDFTDQWYQGLNRGTYATWLAAAWGPVFLSGSAESTAGKWRAAQLPQFDAGSTATGNWGGSTNAVIATTDQPIAAAELARWINVEKEPATMFATEQLLFPPSSTVLEDPSFLTQAPDFYGGQEVNRVFAEASENVNATFQWLPFMDYAFSSYTDVVAAAIVDRGDLVAALASWESRMKDYATEQGFTVR